MSSTDLTESLIPTSQVDYLDEDKPIRGQNYVCLSFISPEDVLANKDVFYLQRFIGSFSKELNELVDGLSKKYPDDKGVFDVLKENHQHFFDMNSDAALQEQFRFFKQTNEEAIEKEFYEKNNFRTSIRGIKVRGVFESVPEAQNRAEFLKKMGDKFDIFVAQVGCWCPWSPNPEAMQDTKYAETQLNTLVAKYKENMTLRDLEFEERKSKKIAEAEEKVKEAKAATVSEEGATVSEVFDAAAMDVSVAPSGTPAQ